MRETSRSDMAARKRSERIHNGMNLRARLELQTESKLFLIIDSKSDRCFTMYG